MSREVALKCQSKDHFHDEVRSSRLAGALSREFLQMRKMLIYFHLLRVNHYIKNGFVFLPLFFNREITAWESLLHVFEAALSFCFAASSVYIFNDSIDVEADRLHEHKRLRPIAAGEISVPSAGVIAAGFLITALFIAYFVNTLLIAIVGGYVILNIAYSLKLKRISILDVSIIASGFVLRLFMGGIAGGVILSKWIVLVTFVLSLFLALAKRRDDVIIYQATGQKPRQCINGYNLEFLNASMSIMAAITLMTYILYTVSPEVILRFGSDNVYFTVLFVIIGILRYLQIALVGQKSGSPTDVLVKDRVLQLCLLGWIGTFVVLLYIR
jgi:decaprenyl-phosphate phosphoribosyltransferase